jgi:hypothetical protein
VRLTPEWLATIRTFLRENWLMRDGESALEYARELLAELDAVTRERDDAREWQSVWGPDVALWGRLYAECVGDKTDAEIGRLVREMAREYHASAVTV